MEARARQLNRTREVNVMEICITIGGTRHCFWIPIYEYPVIIRKGPGPVNYEALVQDATLVATIYSAANKVSDAKAKAALQSGVESAVKAMQAHAGAGVEIHAPAPSRD
jgi:hypothetical protein